MTPEARHEERCAKAFVWLLYVSTTCALIFAAALFINATLNG